MKIALNTTIRPVGFDYASELHELGALETFCCAFPKRKSGDLCKRLGSKVVFCDFWQTVFLVLYRLCGSTHLTRSLASFSKRRLDRFTAKHLGGADAAVFYSGAGLATIRACLERGILSVCQVHHSHVLEQEETLRREASLCGMPYTPIYSAKEIARQLQEFEAVDVILCPSTAVAESFARRGTPESKLCVVPHGVDLRSATQPSERKASPATGPLRVLYVGQLHYRKGLRFLRDALQGLPADQFTCRLVGPDFGVSGLSDQNQLPNMQSVGARKGADLWREYEQADVFVLPSLEEGFGLVVLEAMRAGLPVIITSEVGAKDFVTDGVEGFIVPAGDAAALRSKLQWTRDNPSQRTAMGMAAAARAQVAGGWKESARKLLSDLADRKKRAGRQSSISAVKTALSKK